MPLISAWAILPGLAGFLAAFLGAPLLVLGLVAGAIATLGLIGLFLVRDSSGSGALGVLAISCLFLLAGGSLELGALLGGYLR